MTREEAIDVLKDWDGYFIGHSSDDVNEALNMAIKALEQEPKIGYCKDCKWWKDSNGLYRRGIQAESWCPINRSEVFEGNGYCYMYEPRESEDKDE